MATGCIHDVRWYVRQFGAALSRELPTAADLRHCLAHAISTVAATHADTCDITHTGTPSSTVAIARERDNALDYLVLSDTTIIFDCYTDLHIITDDSVEQVAVTEPQRLPQTIRRHPGTRRAATRPHRRSAPPAEHPRGLLARRIPTQGCRPCHHRIGPAHRPPARGTTDRRRRPARRPFRITDWPGFLDILNARGPRQLIHQIREAEASDPHGQRSPRRKPHDDATIAYLTTPTTDSSPQPPQFGQTSSQPVPWPAIFYLGIRDGTLMLRTRWCLDHPFSLKRLLRRLPNSLLLLVAAVLAAAAAYRLYTFASAEPSLDFYGSMGVYTSDREASASLIAEYFSTSPAEFNASAANFDTLDLHVRAGHTGSGDTHFVVVLIEDARLRHPHVSADHGLRVTSRDVYDGAVAGDTEYTKANYQTFSFTLRRGVSRRFVDISGKLMSDIADRRGGHTLVRLPTMGDISFDPLFEFNVPPNHGTRHFSLSATPHRHWFTPRNVENYENAGYLDTNTFMDVARPPLDRAYRSLLVWSGSAIYSPEAHLTNAVQRRQSEGLLFGAGILAGLASSLLVEAALATRRRHT
jgi:hypothetical protein